MGSLLYERGVFFTRSFDELNLSQPELVGKVHGEYLDAGADVIETNSFGATRLALARHGHADKVVEISRAAVALGRRALAGRPGFLAGAVGPTGVAYDEAPEHERAQVRAALAEQIAVLAGEGVDLLLIETFTYLDEIDAAIAAAKGHGLPIVAQVVFNPDGTAHGGASPLDVARRLIAAGADAVGASAGAGPPTP